MHLPAQLIRYQRRTLSLGAALVAGCYLVDLVHPNAAVNMAVRTTWLAALLLGAWLQQPGRPRAARGGAHLVAAVSGAAVLATVANGGGTRSVFAGLLLAAPFAVAVALPGFPSAAAITGAALAAGGAALRLLEGQGTPDVASWLLLSVATGALATSATFASLRLWRQEVELGRARAEALQGLHDAEQRRALAERLAEVGRQASGVARRIGGPLDAVRANLRWLGEPVGEAGPGDEEERRAVMQEALDAMRRIGRAVDDLERVAQPPEPTPHPGELAPIRPAGTTLN